MSGVAVRPALEGEGETRRAGDPALVAERAGRAVASGVLDGAGGPSEPGVPVIRLAPAAPDREADDDALAAIVDGLLEAARARGLDRVLAHVDPLDADRLALLESRGFRPTGRHPYFPLGGGQLQYVTGYMDATGATLDLARQP